MAAIRVLVVEDSLTVRKRLVEILAADPEIDVVGEAQDGKTAIELCSELRPDVVTLDMQLPILSGLAVTEYIMAYCPTPILIVSASSNRGDLFKTYDALAAGALDAVEKPKSDERDQAWERSFVSTVKMISRIRVITHMRGRVSTGRKATLESAPQCEAYRLVAIGASTGGPVALLEILRALPSRYPLPIVVVNHIGEAFGSLLAEWLDSQSQLQVSFAKHGELLPEEGQGKVILAPPGRHTVICSGRVRLIDDAERHSCKPSVDVLFESVAREIGRRSIACLLTGMGKDGAQGLLAIRRAGGRTLVQDQASSVIFGMPHEAIRIGAAESVLDIREIAPTLITLAGIGEAHLCR